MNNQEELTKLRVERDELRAKLQRAEQSARDSKVAAACWKADVDILQRVNKEYEERWEAHKRQLEHFDVIKKDRDDFAKDNVKCREILAAYIPASGSGQLAKHLQSFVDGHETLREDYEKLKKSFQLQLKLNSEAREENRKLEAKLKLKAPVEWRDTAEVKGSNAYDYATDTQFIIMPAASSSHPWSLYVDGEVHKGCRTIQEAREVAEALLAKKKA